MLYPGVKVRSNGPDPLNPLRWEPQRTLVHPFSNFWRFIRHRLIIFGMGDDECWCWDCRNREFTDKFNPQIWAAWNWDSDAPISKNHEVRKFVGQIFYTFPDNYWVYRDKDICKMPSCMRPSHLMPAPPNSPRAKYGTD